MNLQQLQNIVAIVDHDNHISAAAAALHVAQPSVSRQLRMLEAELGIIIFARTKNRIVGLTEPGKLVADIARRIGGDVRALETIKTDLTAIDTGTLTVATTHTHANYVLPRVIAAFVSDYPRVDLALVQGDPESVCEMVLAGRADLAVGTDPPRHFPGLVEFPCRELPRAIVAPEGHPILTVAPLALEAVARFPLIVYDTRFSSHRKVLGAFQRAGLTPKIVMTAIDAGVCKTYIRMNLGIAVLSAITYDKQRDAGLRSRDASHLFEPSTTHVMIQPNLYPRLYVVDFISRLAPHFTTDAVRARLQQEPADGAL